MGDTQKMVGKLHKNRLFEVGKLQEFAVFEVGKIHKSIVFQVGKTFWIKNFCSRNFEQFIYVDISQHALAPDAFANAKTVEAFYLAVSAFSNKKVLPGKTVVFIDEIQKAPKADFRTLAKPLALDGRCRVIFSGSLLGVTEHKTFLEPTGYMYEERMYPLDFEEFLWANSVQEDVIAKAKECFENRQEVPTFIHEKLLDLFRLYLMVGGLPGRFRLMWKAPILTSLIFPIEPLRCITKTT